MEKVVIPRELVTIDSAFAEGCFLCMVRTLGVVVAV